MNKNIVVIGSANMDTTHYLEGGFPEDITSESTNKVIKTRKTDKIIYYNSYKFDFISKKLYNYI